MKTIYKYPLELETQQTLFMPMGAKIISAQIQDDVICLWAIVDPDILERPVSIFIFGTGEKFDPRGKVFIGTVQQKEFVWHIFKEEY